MISPLLTEGTPSIFSLKGEPDPPPRYILSISSGSLPLLIALNSIVTDPTVEKTVSKETVSAEKEMGPETGLARGSQPRKAAAINKINMSCLISIY
jgi:hypothetical protein